MANNITAELLLENKEFIRSLKTALSSIDDFANKSNKSMKAVGGGLSALASTAVAYIGVRAVKEMVKFAGEIDNVQQAFNNLSASAGKNSEKLIEAMKKASKGTISEMEIMRASNLALQLMGTQVAEYLPKMAEIATATARAQGKEAATMLNDIVVAAGRQSVQILDNLGVSSVTAGQYMEEYAAKLGKTREQMTGAEKSAAFFYATMKAGEDVMRRTGTATDTIGDKVQRLDASWANLGKNINTLVTPPLVGLINLANKVIEAINKSISQAEELGRRVGSGKYDKYGVSYDADVILQTEYAQKRFEEYAKVNSTKMSKYSTWSLFGMPSDRDRAMSELKNRTIQDFYKLNEETQKAQLGLGAKKAPGVTAPTVFKGGMNKEAEKYKEAHSAMSEYYQRMGDYQAAAQLKELEGFHQFLGTAEAKKANIEERMLFEKEIEDRLVVAKAQAFNTELAYREQLYRARIGLESSYFKGAVMFTDAAAQLMSSENKALFKVGQAGAIGRAGINAAEAITKGYSQLGPIGGTAFAALMGVVTATQIASIVKQKPPGDVKIDKKVVEPPAPPTVPKFAKGVFDIPYDTFAMLHKGETVMPKAFAESVRAGELAVGNSGPSVNIHVAGSVIDAQGLLDIVNKGQEEIGRRMGASPYAMQTAY